MKNKILIRLIVMLLSASILLSSTGVYAIIASAEGLNKSLTSTTVTQNDSTTDSSETDQFDKDTKTTAEVETEGGQLTPKGAKVVTEGGVIATQSMGSVTWVGTGTELNPYQVSSLEHFLSIQSLINNTSSSNKYFILTQNMDFSSFDYRAFYSPDSYSNEQLPNYNGFRSFISLNPLLAQLYPNEIFFELDGNGKTVSGINIKNTGFSTSGIFGYLSENTVIKDLTFSDCRTLSSSLTAAVSSVIAVQNAGTITNCNFESLELEITSTNGFFASSVELAIGNGEYNLLAGNSVITGSNLGTISDCTATDVKLKVDSTRKYISIVAGQNSSTIANVTVEGVKITSTSSNQTTATTTYTGVITGYNNSTGDVVDCYVDLPGSGTTPVTKNITYGATVGGVAGYNDGSVTGCTVQGSVSNTESATSTNYNMSGINLFGGIVAENNGTVSNCSALDIGMYFSNNANTTIYGGIVGKNTSLIAVSNCVASGDMGDTGYAGYTTIQTGGIIGQATSQTFVSNCYALVSLSMYARDIGAIIGRAGNVNMLTNCYWSSSISGRNNPCTYKDSQLFNNDMDANVKFINVGVNSTAINTKANVVPTWGSATVSLDTTTPFTLKNGTDMSISSTGSDFTVTGGSNSGVYDEVKFKVDIVLPSGVGAQSNTEISQGLSVKVLQTSTAAANAGQSYSNPIIITDSNEFSLINQVSYANYKLGNNFTVPAGWNPLVFYGTLNGDGKTITTNSILFTGIYGKRNGNTATQGWENSPENLKYGYINGLNVTLNSAIPGAIFGRALNATFDSINLDATGSGWIDVSNSGIGSFVDVFEGNNYAVDCMTDIDIYIKQKSLSNIGAFTGNADGNVCVIDNCGSSSDILKGTNYDNTSGTPSGIGGFIGVASSNAVISNCFASGLIESETFNHVVIGRINGSPTLSNIYWSLNSNDESVQPVATPASTTQNFIKWMFNESSGTVAEGGTSYVTLSMPQNINAFNNVSLSDLDISVEDSSYVTITNTEFIDANNVKITFAAASETFNTTLTVNHKATGLNARIGILTGLSRSQDNYYLIETREDLIYLNENYPQLSTDPSYGYLVSANFRVCGDIDMSGYTFNPMGALNYISNHSEYSGHFEGDTKPGGAKYTISNLSISSGAMFQVVRGCTISNLSFKNVDVNSNVAYTAVFAGYMYGDCTFEDIDLNNVSIETSATYAGVFAGMGDASSTCVISGVTVNGVAIDAGTNNYVGGFIGSFVGSSLRIGADSLTSVVEPDVSVTDISINGSEYVGGLVGMMGSNFNSSGFSTTAIGTLVVNGVNIEKSQESSNKCEISGAGYVGGLVGVATVTASSILKDSTIKDTIISNTSTIAVTTGLTGGIAGAFMGTIENCDLIDSEVSGCVVAGIIARTASISNTVTIQDCDVLGNSTISSSAANNTSASGIMGQHNRNKDVTIENCNVGSGVSIQGGYYNAGVLGAHNALAFNANSKVRILSCKSYAQIYSGSVTGAAATGGIVGVINIINSLSITDCVVGGNIYGATNTGGIIGYTNTGTTSFNAATSMDGYVVNNCYIAAPLRNIEGSSSNTKGKIVGNSSSGNFVNNNTIDTAFQSCVFSSYPDSVSAAFGKSEVMGYLNSINCYVDVNKPSKKYIHGSSDYVELNNEIATKSVNITNLSDSSLVSHFSFVTDQGKNGWFVKDSETLTINSATLDGNGNPSSIELTAIEANNNNSVYIDYLSTQATKADSTIMSISDPQMNGESSFDPFVLQISIPVNCNIQDILIGNGTDINPYQILTKSNAITVADIIIENQEKFDDGLIPEIPYIYVKLATNLHYESTEQFKPFGTDNIPFYGEFDGQENTISGVSGFYTSGINWAIFANAKDSVIKNLSVEDFSIILNNPDPEAYTSYAGSVLAYGANVTLENITANNISISNFEVAGGIAGHVHVVLLTGASVFKDITVQGVSINALDAAGGVAGEFIGTMGDDSLPSGYDITIQAGTDELGQTITNTIKGERHAGGIVGLSRRMNSGDSTISSYNKIMVSDTVITAFYSSTLTSTTVCAGGILGYLRNNNDEASFSDCYVDESVLIYGSYTNISLGGVIGISSTLTGSIAFANTKSFAKVNNNSTSTSAQATSAGGFLGGVRNPQVLTIVDCVASGTVSSKVNAGGVVGKIILSSGEASDFTMTGAVASMIENTVVSAKVVGVTGTGILIGEISEASTVFPDSLSGLDYTVEPFKNVYYSSYKNAADFVGNGYLSTAQSYLLNGVSTSFTKAYYNLNSIEYEGGLFILGNDWQLVEGADIEFVDHNNIVFDTLITGSYQSFIADGNVSFEIDPIRTSSGDNAGEYKTLTAEDVLLEEFNAFNAGDHVMRSIIEDSAGEMVLRYTNGLQLSLGIVAFSTLDGNGSLLNPFILRNANHFTLLNVYPDRHFKLGADINFSLEDNWTPASTFSGTFDGYYEGTHYKIENLVISEETGTKNVGLFGQVSGANATVSNVTFNNLSVTGYNNIGSVAGSLTLGATLDNIVVNNSEIKCLSSSAASIAFAVNVGGIVGYADHTSVISGCTLNSTGIDTKMVTTAGNHLMFYNTGGIAGTAMFIDNCEVSGSSSNPTNIVGTAVGGILGAPTYNDNVTTVINPTVTGCELTGNVNLAGTNVGGIMGYIHYTTLKDYKITISGCVVGNDVVISDDDNASNFFAYYGTGGILGAANMSFSNASIKSVKIFDCQSYAQIDSKFSTGGIIGIMYNTFFQSGGEQQFKVYDCVGGGTIINTSNNFTSMAKYSGAIIGGIVKYSSNIIENPVSYIDNCISSATLTSTGTALTGFVVGSVSTAMLGTGVLATNVFKDIYYSSYQQRDSSNEMYQPFGNDSYDINSELIDVSFNTDSETAQTPSFMVKNFAQENPGAGFDIIAITPLISGLPIQTTYTLPVSIKPKDGVDLGLVSSDAEFNNYLTAAGINVTLQGFTLDQGGASMFDIGSQPAVYEDVNSATVTPNSEGAGYIEAVLTGGLKIGVMVVSFAIEGAGTLNDPFLVNNPQTLKIISDMPFNFYWEQTQDIVISESDYDSPDGIFYNDGKGFAPIGTKANVFDGHYDGKGYFIRGLYINRPNQTDVGLFGHVGANAGLKNIHVEISEQEGLSGITGYNNVGGLVGNYCSSEIIENCSVSYGAINGEWSIGGLVGYLDGNVSGCFTTSTVYSSSTITLELNDIIYATAGGIAGIVMSSGLNPSEIKNSFSTSLVHAHALSGGLAGYVRDSHSIVIENCFFNGSVSMRASISQGEGKPILLGDHSSINSGNVTAKNIYVAATNAHYSDKARLFNSAIEPGSGNIYYDSSMLGVLDNNNPTFIQAINTKLLTSGIAPAGFTAQSWKFVDGSYPILKMSDIYSRAFSVLSCVPIEYDQRDLSNGGVLDGIMFPMKVKSSIDISMVSESTVGMTAELNATSSIYSASFAARVDYKNYTDTAPYSVEYDTQLYGNGSNRSTDLLFKNGNGSITTYRNVFGKTEHPTIKYQTMRTPVATYSFSAAGVKATRDVRIPYVDETNEGSKTYHYYFSTERQLRAINEKDTVEPVGSKFAYYREALNLKDTNNSDKIIYVHITGDIELSDKAFKVIYNFKGRSFNGHGSKISNLTINQSGEVGFFQNLSYPVSGNNRMIIENLVFEKSTVIGTDNVGTLAGSIDEGVVVKNCSVVYDGENNNFVMGRNYVGGLIGKSNGYIGYDYTYSFGQYKYIEAKQSSGVNVDVEGQNFVGGFVGYATKAISNCYSNGSVVGEFKSDSITYTDGGNVYEEPRGVGGFVGVLKSKATSSFSSSNVLVDYIDPNADYNKMGVGGFAGYISDEGEISSAVFSSGNVHAKGIAQNLYHIEFGVGGLVGVTDSTILSCYSSSTIIVDYGSAITTNATLGVGGVLGIANSQLQDSYSSGSVQRLNHIDPIGTKTIGGVIGNAKGGLSYSQLYFDILNNTDQNLTAIGGVADTGLIKGVETRGFFGSTINETELYFESSYWGANNAAYPYLKAFFSEGVSNWIKYPAVLSVIAVTPDERDESANDGLGISMALQMPSTLTITGTEYNLEWTQAQGAGSGIISLGNNVYAPIRTANIGQSMDLIVYVENNEEYGSREYNRQCADMMGTQTNPYLVSTKLDVQHIGQASPSGNYPNLYDQWISPIDAQGRNYTSKVHYRLMGDVDMTMDVTLADNGSGGYNITVQERQEGEYYSTDGSSIPAIPIGADLGVYDLTTPEPYDKVTYQGMSIDGYDYKIKNFTFTMPLIDTLDVKSEIKNILFDNISIKSDKGMNVSLIKINYGFVDGVTIRNTGEESRVFSTSAKNAAGLVLNNYGSIKNSVSDVTIVADSNIGGIAATNNGGTIERCVSACDITTDAVGNSNIGGFVGTNTNGGIISDSLSFGSIQLKSGSTAQKVGGFVGVNQSSITNAYSRTNTEGYDIVGAFAGENSGNIKNAYAAGRATVTNISSTQDSAFSGLTDSQATETDIVFDKAMSGSSLHEVFENAAKTEDMLTLNDFSETTKENFVIDEENGAYPQLNNIVNITQVDSSTMQGDYELLKSRILKTYSQLSVYSINTAHGQYIDTLALGSKNILSNDIDVVWSANKPAIIIGQGNVLTVPNTQGTAVLKASMSVETNEYTQEKIQVNAYLPIGYGGYNPNFATELTEYGDGTSTDPYLINDLTSFSYLPYYATEVNTSYKLINDIDFEGASVDIERFEGNFDGGYCTISNYTVGSNNNGLFGNIIDGSVTRLSLLGVKLTKVIEEAQRAQHFGLLAGSINGADSYISDCSVIGEINISAVDSQPLAYIGGLVGYTGPGVEIDDCATSGRVLCTIENSDNAIGGVVGYADTTNLSDLLSTSYVLGEGDIGGIVGGLKNSSALSRGVFAGTALDSSIRTAYVKGANNNVANIVGSCEGNINTVYYDKSMALSNSFIGKLESETNSISNLYSLDTGNLVSESISGWVNVTGDYPVPAGLTNGDIGSLFESAISFIAMPVELISNNGKPTITHTYQIQIPLQTSLGSAVTATEIPRFNQNQLAKSLTAFGTLFTLPDDLMDISDVYTVVSFTIGSGATRYVEPRLTRTINVGYTLVNSSQSTQLDSQTVGILLKNNHGGTITTASNIFTNCTELKKPVFEYITISSNGFYIGEFLPKGYRYKVSLETSPNVFNVCSNEVKSEYGIFVDVSSITDTNYISIKIEIVEITPSVWGLNRVWSSVEDL